MRGNAICVILLFCMFSIISYSQETRLSGTLKMHPWVNLPVIDSNEALGGHHQVATIEEMNAIPVERRQQGMLCTVLDDGFGKQKTYQLTGGIENKNWVVFTSDGTGTNVGDMRYWDGSKWIIIPAGEAGQFLKLSSSKIPIWFDLNVTIPVVSATAIITEITENTAKSGGIIESNGALAITARGICWGKEEEPTIKNRKTEESIETTEFPSTMTDLLPGTLYYVRAYATNSLGTGYGPQVNFISGGSAAPIIGDSYGGGIVFYVFQSGDPGYINGETHGLITAPEDQSSGIQWNNGSYETTGATETALGSGKLNTEKIIETQQTGNYAARLCYDLVLNGYDDWYLPSKDELEKLHLNRTKISNLCNGCYYWSSSEQSDDNTQGWAQFTYYYRTSSGFQSIYDKVSELPVRAIRSF